MNLVADRDLRIVSMWLAGQTVGDIAAELGMPNTTVAARAYVLGLPLRAPGQRAPNLWPSIVAWAKQGYTPLQIAQGIGCGKPHLVAGVGGDGQLVKTAEFYRQRSLKAARTRARLRRAACGPSLGRNFS